MAIESILSLRTGVTIEERGEDLVIHSATTSKLMTRPGPAARSLLKNLRAGGMTADALCDAALAEEVGADPARIYFALLVFERSGFLLRTLVVDGSRLASIEPVAAWSGMREASAAVAYRLSRFACLRREADEMVVECGLGHARVYLHAPEAAAAVTRLVAAHTASDLAASTGLNARSALALLSILDSARAAWPCDSSGAIDEDGSVALQQWEFHDLHFHSQSRLGRRGVTAGLFRFMGALPALTAVKTPMSSRVIPLRQSSEDEMAADKVARASETRRSLRPAGGVPVTIEQLGEFLYRCARVKKVIRFDGPEGTQELSYRVCPSGGALHPIELYLIIANCRGLEPGQYHYDPLAHALEHLCGLEDRQEAMLANGRSGPESMAPEILITLAARFQRTSWKYSAHAYSLILKDVGVLFQQMYLVATEMGLSPCALGSGDSDLFAEAVGLDYYAETSVGEFILSGSGKMPP